MPRSPLAALILLTSALVASGCAPAPTIADQPAGLARSPTQPKRLTVGVGSNLPSPHGAISAPLSGGAEVHQLVTSGLNAVDEYGRLAPLVADAVPSTENGGWKVLPDGRMETTWRLRNGFTWHDGVPVTSGDFVFALQVVRDPDAAPFYTAVLQREVDRVEAPDPSTITVHWKRPFIKADETFITLRTFPKHLLEGPFLEDKPNFANLPYFTSGYVSNGPYKLREWNTGVNALLDAYDAYALGRPKIDAIEIRFIADSNTMLANVLADALDVLIGARHLAFDQALEVQQRWANGAAVFGPNGWSVVHPQMLYANPPIIMQSARFRQAMFMAIDRQALADSLQGGLAPVAHSMFVPSDPMYQPTLSQVVVHPYDPRLAAQIIEELGYRKGSDGMFVDAAGNRLTSEIRTTADIDSTVKQSVAIQHYWNQLGVATEQVAIPPQRQQDREYRSTFCCFEVLQGGHGESGLISRHSINARTAANNWRGAAGTNYSNYVNPEHDAMIDRYLTTIPFEERTRVAGEILRHLTENALFLGMYYVARPTVVRNGLTEIRGRDAGMVATYNVYQWDLQ